MTILGAVFVGLLLLVVLALIVTLETSWLLRAMLVTIFTIAVLIGVTQ